MKITAVLAIDEHLLIGKSGWLPWHIPEDLKHFNTLTRGWVVVMGRSTYFSLPEKFRPLPHRRNIILSSSSVEGVETYTSIDDLLSSLRSEWMASIFVIGGAKVYDQFFEQWLVDTVELTVINGLYEGDIFIKEFRQDFTLEKEEIYDGYRFQTLKKS